MEDRIRCGKVTGFGRFPSRHNAINAAWLEIALTSIDLTSWCQTMLIDDPQLARCEPKTLRCRLLHVAARLTRSARQTRLRIDRTWSWAATMAAAFARLAANDDDNRSIRDLTAFRPSSRRAQVWLR